MPSAGPWSVDARRSSANRNEPTYAEGGVVHDWVTNVPGAVPLTWTLALNNVTLPYVAPPRRPVGGLRYCRVVAR